MSEPKNSDDGWLPLIPAALGALMWIAAIVVFLIGSRMNAKWDYAKSWPPTDAVVTSAGFTQEGQGVIEHYEWFKYRYTVNDHPYEFYTRGTYRAASRLNEPLTHPVGSRFQIYYDPRDPTVHFFAWSREPPRTIHIWIALICALIGAPFFYLSFRWFRASRAG